MKRNQLIFYFIFCLLILPHILRAQTISDDYRRADEMVKLTTEKIYNGNVRPSWIGNTPYFFV